MAYCTKCGASITEGAKYCENCGEPVPQMNSCQHTENNETEYSYVERKTTPSDTEMNPEKPVNGFAIASLILGILAVVLMFVSWHPALAVPDILFGILAIVFGTIGMKRAKLNNSPSGIAIAGLVCGIVSVSVAVLAMLCVGACAVAACSTIDLAEDLPHLF